MDGMGLPGVTVAVYLGACTLKRGGVGGSYVYAHAAAPEVVDYSQGGPGGV